MDEMLSFQILSEKDNVIFDRLHICTWEIGTHRPIVEFGIDINGKAIQNQRSIKLILYTPWAIESFSDLFPELKREENARFIFNEAINTTSHLNGNSNLGVIHEFTNKSKLCILPTKLADEGEKIIVEIDLVQYRITALDHNENVYIRFYVIPKKGDISIQKKGISKTTIIYDTKINERRNIPSDLLSEISKLYYPIINSCYNFNIIPNNIDITFEDKYLKSVRNLEYRSFNEYFKRLISDKKIEIKNKELLVVFNKNSDVNSTYSFFTIYTKEHFGLKQISIVLFFNLLCSFLFFLPSYRGKIYNKDLSFVENLKIIPLELGIVLIILVITLIYVFNPRNIFRR